MPVIKRKPKRRRVRVASSDTAKLYGRRNPSDVAADLDRLADILASGHGTEDDARLYFHLRNHNNVHRLQSIVAKARKLRSWEFMEGCYKQATELYVLASILYEEYPDHVLMPDGAFDELSRFLLRNFKKLPKDFRAWYNITAIDLKAGTGHGVIERPEIQDMVSIITGNPNDDTARLLRQASFGTSAGGKRKARKRLAKHA